MLTILLFKIPFGYLHFVICFLRLTSLLMPFRWYIKISKEGTKVLS